MKNKGITLVALVITIIILLILAGVAITSLTNTGLFKNAKQAKTAMENAENIENATLSSYEKKIENYSTENEIKLKNVDENANIILSTTENIKLQDKYGNKIIIPAGFKIVVNDNTNNATTVDKGIVIEDVTESATKGSQFVWIPVGTIYTDVEHKEENKKVIDIDRYDFDLVTGEEKKYSGSYIEEDKGNKDVILLNRGNTIAKNITEFKNSVSSNNGYYIGRYEARKKVINGKEEVTETKEDTLLNYVTQPTAASISQNMYKNEKFGSDLTNSYAWDTAITFIQKCTEEKTYSKRTSLNVNSISLTGTSIDNKCNIFDMASNISEWTTETVDSTSTPCIIRGGNYYSNNYWTSARREVTTETNKCIGFRPIIYFVNEK